MALKKYFRSNTQVFAAEQSSTGIEINEIEVIRLFGKEAIDEIDDYGSHILLSSEDEPAKSIKDGLEKLMGDEKTLSRRSGVSISAIKDVLDNRVSETGFKNIFEICINLGLDPLRVGAYNYRRPKERLSFGLKALSLDEYGFDETQRDDFRMKIAEAAWIIDTEKELDMLMGKDRFIIDKQEAIHTTALDYEIGYKLARYTRGKLGISLDEVVLNTFSLLTETMNVPLIFEILPDSIAGITVLTDAENKGIIINSSISLPKLLRVSLYHELYHYLWDEERSLTPIKIDLMLAIKSPDSSINLEHSERRANAFAVEFLLPKSVILDRFKSQVEPEMNPSSRSTTKMIANMINQIGEEYGVSPQATRLHTRNSLKDVLNLPDKDWSDIFKLTNLKPKDVESQWRQDISGPSSYLEYPYRSSRRGSLLVKTLEAYEKKLISGASAQRNLDINSQQLMVLSEQLQ